MTKKKDGSRFDDIFSAARSRRDQENTELTQKKPTRKSKSTDPDYVRTTVYLPKQLHRKLKAAAADEDREMSSILEQLLTQWLEERNETQRPDV